jgi:hypothetical protein
MSRDAREDPARKGRHAAAKPLFHPGCTTKWNPSEGAGVIGPQGRAYGSRPISKQPLVTPMAHELYIARIAVFADARNPEILSTASTPHTRRTRRANRNGLV